MNNLHHDAAHRYRSLDDIYYYGGQKARYQIVVQAHVAQRPEEIDLEVGDVLTVAGNHWDGYSKGTNTRTYKTGLYPTFKVKWNGYLMNICLITRFLFIIYFSLR